LSTLGLLATKMAMQDSKLDMSAQDKSQGRRYHWFGLGGMLFPMRSRLVAHYEKKPTASILFRSKVSPNAVSSHMRYKNGLLGPNMVISTACASGSHAVERLFVKIQWGDMDMCVTGGVEATCRH